MRRAAPRRAPPPESEQLDATTKKGLIAAGILLLVAGVIVFMIYGKKKAEDDAVQSRKLEVAEFLSWVKSVDKTSIPAMETGKKTVEENTAKWVGTTAEDEVKRELANWVNSAREITEKKEVTEIFRGAEAAVASMPTLTSGQMKEIRTKLNDLDTRGIDQYDPSWPEKVKQMKAKIDHELVGKIRTEAKAFGDANPGRKALQTYAEAEDFVRKALEDATKAKNKADETEFGEIYKGLLNESDALTEKVVTPEFIESIPWKDLLTGEQAAKWSKSMNVPGFAFRIESGTLTMSPPDKDSKLQASASIGDLENWRHFILEMEFKLEGVATMFFHVNPPPNPPDNRQAYSFDLDAKGGLTPNQKYTMRVEYIGTPIKITFPNSDDIRPWTPDPSWSKRRKGGIAFLIPEGTRITITRMRIRDLR